MCQRVEFWKDGRKVILEFPAPSDRDEAIKGEVQAILRSILREYLKEQGEEGTA